MPNDADGTNASAAEMDSRLQQDIDTLRAGHQHSLIYLTIQPGPESGAAVPSSLNDLVGKQLPASALLWAASGTDWAIWLPDCRRKDAVTVSRLLRHAVSQWRSDSSGSTGAVNTLAGPGCAIGVVVVTGKNWEAATLVKTARLTASIARFSDSDEIRVADQVDPAKISADPAS